MLEEGLTGSIPPLGLNKGILDSPCLLILLIYTKHKSNKMKSWTDPESLFPFPHSPECLAIFCGMFGDTPRNVWRHSPECLAIFPGMFEDISRNVWRHSLEYNILPIPHVPRIPFPVPVFLVLYIAASFWWLVKIIYI